MAKPICVIVTRRDAHSPNAILLLLLLWRNVIFYSHYRVLCLPSFWTTRDKSTDENWVIRIYFFTGRTTINCGGTYHFLFSRVLYRRRLHENRNRSISIQSGGKHGFEHEKKKKRKFNEKTACLDHFSTHQSVRIIVFARTGAWVWIINIYSSLRVKISN